MSRYTRIHPTRHANGDVSIRMNSVTANRLANLMLELEDGIAPLLEALGDMPMGERGKVQDDFEVLARALQNLSDIPNEGTEE